MEGFRALGFSGSGYGLGLGASSWESPAVLSKLYGLAVWDRSDNPVAGRKTAKVQAAI